LKISFPMLFRRFSISGFCKDDISKSKLSSKKSMSGTCTLFVELYLKLFEFG
jgi:hypothetical protein